MDPSFKNFSKISGDRRLSLGLMLVLILGVVVLAGCGGGSAQFPVETTVLPYTPDQISAREEAKFAEYKLRAGDRISVSFKYLPELNQKHVLVLPDGNITMAGLGMVIPAEGKSVRDLDVSLTGEFSRDYRDPDLSIAITEITKPEVYVLGEVKKPGLYELPAKGIGIIQAISAAGGFTSDAQKSDSVILRAADEGFMIRKFDLSSLQHMGILDLSYMEMEAYDIVYVPRSSLGDFKYLSDAIFGSALNISGFFWDIAAISRLNDTGGIIR